MRALVLFAGACLLAGSACHTGGVRMTQLQIRQMQTRTYDIHDTKRALKAVLNVLQDEAFIPKQVNADVGFVYASKEVDLEDSRERFWAKFWKGREDARWAKNSIVECAANVTGLSQGMRVRLSFQVKVFDNRGQVVSVQTIDDPLFYQDFFSRVDKGIFLEKAGV